MDKRVTIFAGHYGSGKTTAALNFAIYLRDAGKPVALADMDIVNPYFRAADSGGLLAQRGIALISSPYANSNVDLPSMPQELYSVADNRDVFAVLDVGGDDRGALALGRYAPAIMAENDYEMLLVINLYRPLTGDCEKVMAVMADIERASGMAFTGILNNSNLGAETTAGDILASLPYAGEISAATGLPVLMTAADAALEAELREKVPNLFLLRFIKKNRY